MTEFLVRRLIRDAQNTEDPSVREAYGRLAGIVGVVCNVLLFVGKFLLGTLTGSGQSGPIPGVGTDHPEAAGSGPHAVRLSAQIQGVL